ncbi:MAG: helix-turn-helix transcriptional regulator, partial [Clostridia bacterium]|nr:helix-turn-helix transcriptional regulator [Clostridia bacterium]
MNINETIKQRRLQLGLNANDVAEALGISRATLYRYES